MSIKNLIIYWIPKILIILLGIFFIISGEFDDSPGLQGIGLVLIIIVGVAVVKGWDKKQ